MVPRPIAPIAVGVAIGILLASTLVWISLPRQVPFGCNSTPSGLGGTALAFSVPVETTVGAKHWYNFTVQSTGGSFEFDNLAFQVQLPGGANASPGPAWKLIVLNQSGTWLGSYSLYGSTAGTWTSGGTTLLVSGQVVSLLSSPNRLSGDAFVASVRGGAPCSWAGSTSIGIP